VPKRPLVAVLAPEPIRPRMAGMGIRSLELARALGREMDTRLLVPNDPAEAAQVAGDVPIAHAPPESDLARAAHGARAAVVSGHAANYWFHQAPRIPVAADLYDPFFIENLHYAESLGPETARHDHATLDLALARADFFLCASPAQRLFYAGALFACGRIGQFNFPGDPGLDELLGVVPFGVSARPASGARVAGRRAAGVPSDGALVLFGGIYDWNDPGLLLDAWPEVRRALPSARLLFLASPNPDTTPQRAYGEAQRRTRELDPDGRSVVFSPWLPYESRADLYAAADVLVSISSEGLETDLAYRTRLIDAAWGGLPSISVAGGPLASELESAGAGWSVERSPEALARALVEGLTDPDRLAEAGRAGRRFAAERSWERVSAPLVAWCRRAEIDPNRLPFPPEREALWRRFTARVRPA